MLIRTRRTFALVLTLIVTAVPGLTAQEKASETLLTVNHYLDYETVAAPRISPDGGRIIFTRQWVNKIDDRFDNAIWLMNADGSQSHFLVKGSSAVWSPDGTRIAYLGEGEPRGSQIFVRWMNDAGAASQITHVMESPGDIKWSPDGKWIGFSMFVPKSSSWAIDMPAAPAGARWTAPPRVVDRLHYRADRRGFLESGYVHLFVVPADGGTPRALTSGDWNVGARFDGQPGGVGWDWTPDGKTIVFTGLMENDHDMRYRDSDIYAVDVASGRIRKLTEQKGSWGDPAVSPDGQWIAFTGYPFTKQTYKTSELFVMRADGSGMKKISGNADRDFGGLFWAADNSGVYATVPDRGSSNVVFTALTGGTRAVTTGAHMLSLTSVARNGIAAAVRSAPQAPPDVYRLNLKQPAELAQLTRVNEDVLTNKKLGQVEEIWYTSTGGARVQGWIVKPPDFNPSVKYPMIMEIHGGPHGMYNVGFSYMYQNFAANGFVVLYTNPRGSTGYGTDFGNAINLRYPGVDYDDLMAGVDSLVRRGYVDEKSMFVGGCSGGGVLSSWVVGHTNRFAAAAVRCPVMNWISFAGNTDVPLFTHNWFEKPFWEDPTRWLEQSPLMYVGKVQTPTLIMTGELDLRTPMAQSEEYYVALKMRGVPTKLLRFQGEFHGTSSKPSNFMRTQLYMMSWYKQYAGKTAVTSDR
jgi:dipeptidyl aminopeptidase/acylaminoacyl peptidase